MSDSQSQQLAGAFLAYFAIAMIFGLAIFVLYIVCFWRIFSKAGFSGWMSLLSLIPGVGQLVIILILAFGEWPALRELNARRQQMGMGGPQYPNPPFPPNPPYPGNPPYPQP
jgi:hypothetical protein